MVLVPDTSDNVITCPVTGEQFNKDDSHRFGVGFSHYKADGTRSYSQVFNTLHCATRPAALTAIKQRIDNHHEIPFGEYDPAVHNPGEETDHKTCQVNLEYNQEGGLHRAHLPKKCAVCNADLAGKDVFVPHVDDSTNGHAYQDYVQWANQGATIEQCTFGACSMPHAQALAHTILDEVIEPAHQILQAGKGE